jgi:hypothetical protein
VSAARLLFILLLACASRVTAASRPDSALPVQPVGPAAWVSDAALTDIESNYQQTGNHRQAFNRLLTLLHLDNAGHARKIRFRLLSDMAGISARMRLYPLAMRCYASSLQNVDDLPQDSIWWRDLPTAVSVPISIDSIEHDFNDGKQTATYALLIHVQQPVPGKRKVFVHLTNTGHTFITLIKYNSDNSIVCRSFGFYPKKVNLLSGTPALPATVAVVKNDARHDWNETAGKFISSRQFRHIMAVLQRYNRVYDLNRNNCTDFGLTIAAIGGITIPDTYGRWPLGSGNNPGYAGQSMLLGKTTNDDPGPLFVVSNHIPH